jgi:hypothetical protein
MRLFGALCLVLAGLSDRAAQDSKEAEVDREWLARDLKRVEQLRAALALPELTVEALQRALQSPDVREDRDIGCGARRVELAAYGGYTTAWIDVLARAGDRGHESRVAALRIVQRGSTDPPPGVVAALREAWKDDASLVGAEFEREREDAKLFAALRADTGKALGGRVGAEVPDELRVAFDRLASWSHDLIVGDSFGIDGGPPPGAGEIAALAGAQRFDLVSAVLRGFNPEGRVYAAHALLARGRLDPADAAAIAQLRALPVEISVSVGCVVSRVTFGEALAHLER